MPFESSGETGLKILIVAESLFANYGLNGVSLRRITTNADVNLASVNYHYGDKKALFRNIILYRLRKINEVRIGGLTTAEHKYPHSMVPLREIIDLLAGPLFQPSQDNLQYNLATMRLLGRIYSEPIPLFSAIVNTELQPTMMRFGQAIRRHLPHLSPSDYLWRFSFVIGAMHHTLATLHDMKNLTKGICRNDDPGNALRNFVEFSLAALIGSAR